MDNAAGEKKPMTLEQQRELIVLAIGMLEGASWMKVNEESIPDMLDTIATILRKALGMGVAE